jgi:peptidoglycan/xylan/chitin deacetylase (PgdA/CDA1 family)
MSLLILTYHYFHDDHPADVPVHDYQYSLSKLILNRHLQYLREAQVTIKTPDFPFFDKKSLRKDRQVLITIDDGHRSIEEHALEFFLESDIKPLVAVISGNVGKEPYMNWPGLRSLAAYGFSVQSHGVTHCDLTRLTDAELKQELSGSRKAIEDNIGLPVNILAAPMGKINHKVTDFAHESGYEAVLTSFTGINDPFSDSYLLRRFQVKAGQSIKPIERYFRPLSAVRMVGGLKNIAKRVLA